MHACMRVCVCVHGSSTRSDLTSTEKALFSALQQVDITSGGLLAQQQKYYVRTKSSAFVRL